MRTGKHLAPPSIAFPVNICTAASSYFTAKALSLSLSLSLSPSLFLSLSLCPAVTEFIPRLQMKPFPRPLIYFAFYFTLIAKKLVTYSFTALQRHYGSCCHTIIYGKLFHA